MTRHPSEPDGSTTTDVARERPDRLWLDGSRMANAVLRPDVILCAVVFLATTAWGVATEGYGIDDWMQATGPDDEWLYFYDRWVTHGLGRFLFRGHYVPSLQLLGALASFIVLSRILVRYALGEGRHGLAVVLTFTIGVNHFYMVELLSFSSHILGYALAMAASAVAFDQFYRASSQRSARAALPVLLGAQLLALTLGSYQSLALLGGLIPCLVLIDSARTDLRAFGRFAIACAVGSTLALALYALELRAYEAISGVVPPPGVPSKQFFGHAWDAVAETPRILKRLHSGAISGGFPAPVARIEKLLSAAIGLLAVTAAGVTFLMHPRGGLRARVLAAARVALGAGIALGPLPILFIYVVKAYLAGRAYAYLGFLQAALVLVLAKVIADQLPSWLRNVRIGVLALLGAMALFHASIASAVWDDRTRIDRRNKALAQAIFQRVSALPGYQGGPFKIYGTLHYKDVSWGGALGMSTFYGEQTVYAIFEEMYGLSWQPSGISAPPKPCPAFPAHASVFMEAGEAYVCVQAYPAENP